MHFVAIVIVYARYPVKAMLYISFEAGTHLNTSNQFLQR